VESAVRFIKDEIYRLPQRLSPLGKKEIEKTISTATEAILKHEESNKEELRHLRLVASTSTLLLIFSHEVKSLLGALDNSENALKVIQDKLTSQDRDLVREIRESLSESKRRFDDLLGMTSLIGVDSRSAKPGKLALFERIEKARKCFQLIINSYDIGVDYTDVPNNIVVNNMLEAELYAILLNVLSNSIKSVIGAGGDKKIRFTASRENGKTIIRIMDTGLGLDPSHYEDVFVPFVADPDGRLYEKLKHNLNPEDKYIVGTGSGLGLSIVREIVQVHNGSISFTKPKTNWSTELEIVLP
jgi:signal transduction histidine kinase